MFKKPLAHQSNATPLRSSARRHVLSQALEQYPLYLRNEGLGPPSSDESSHQIAGAAGQAETVDGYGGATASMSEKDLGKLIMPEGLRSSSFKTSGGVEGTLYSSAEGDPLWMSFGRASKELIPTLYTLAKDTPYPPVPLIQLHHPVPPPLFTGAPLFLPAVKHITRPWLLPDLPESSIVAFVISPEGNETVEYLGVGRIAAKNGTKEAVERFMRHRQEGADVDEGKFADILCIKGDHLWEAGSKPKLGRFVHPSPFRPIAPAPSTHAVDAASAGPSRSRSPSPPITQQVAALSVEGQSQEQSLADDSEPLTPSEVSTLLSVALHQALSGLSSSDFPMPASTLYSAHVLPNRPAYIPKAKRDTAVIAKSEWKKLAKWMKEASKDKLITIKESKGEVTVTALDASHPSVQNHRPFLTIAQEETRLAKRAAREAAAAEDNEAGPGGSASGGSGSKNKQIAIEELWKPAGSGIDFWAQLGVDEASWHPRNIVRPKIDDFIDKNNLAERSDPRMVRVGSDGPLASALGKACKGEVMLRDDIARILRADGQVAHSVNGAVKKGNVQPITMVIKTRAGRKTVTIISGFETFGIDPNDLADELRRVCTASATVVGPLQGASPKLGLQEVMVQGSQTKLVIEALVARGVPKRWIK